MVTVSQKATKKSGKNIAGFCSIRPFNLIPSHVTCVTDGLLGAGAVIGGYADLLHEVSSGPSDVIDRSFADEIEPM